MTLQAHFAAFFDAVRKLLSTFVSTAAEFESFYILSFRVTSANICNGWCAVGQLDL